MRHPKRQGPKGGKHARIIGAESMNVIPRMHTRSDKRLGLVFKEEAILLPSRVACLVVLVVGHRVLSKVSAWG